MSNVKYTQAHFNDVPVSIPSDFVSRFCKFYTELGEKLIGTVEPDVILQRFKTQGYWSGVKYNIYFNRGKFYAQPRLFGGYNE